MWHSSDESAQMEARARGAEKGRRDDDEVTADNVDSGFLSAGNMQVSAEIRDSETPQKEEDRRMTGPEDRRATAPASGATTSVSPSPSATVAAVAGMPARVIDSGVVDVDLSEGLHQLTLGKQSGCLNPLAVGSGEHPGRPEPTTILELTPVKAGPGHVMPQYWDELLLEQHQRDGAKKRAIMSENTWQLYYAQDDDGDT